MVPAIETNNTLSNPEGPEWQFLVGEGCVIPSYAPAACPP